MKNDRLKELLYRAINIIECDNEDELVDSVSNEWEWFENKLGITKEELLEIGVDWLHPNEYDIYENDDEEEDEEDED